MIPLPEDTTFDPASGRLDIRHSHGLFSNCTVTLWALTSLYPRGEHVRVDWSSQDLWRDQNRNQTNLFDDYFVADETVPPQALGFLPHVRHHDPYDNLPYRELRPYLQRFFQPAPAVAELVTRLTQKYAINYEKTVGLCYRGTDKWHEIGAIGPDYYFEQARRALDKDPEMRLLVQTDEGSFRDKAMMVFGERAFFLEELPITYSRTAMHFISEKERQLSNYDLGIHLLAAILILSKSRYLVSHTGNVGLWIYLFRGNAQGACQLIPARPEIISNFPGVRNTIERQLVLQKLRLRTLARRLVNRS